MKRAIKQEWLTALRSGQFQQGHTVLHGVNEDGVHEYCCLGVLCSLAERENAVERTGTGGTLSYGSYSTMSAHYLPEEVSEWASLVGRIRAGSGSDADQLGDPGFFLDLFTREGSSYVTLSSLNDAGFTFDQIADVIEYFIPEED